MDSMPRQVWCMSLRHSDKTRPRYLVRVLPLLRERRTAMTGAIIGTAIVFFPAAPLFLFMHGKDITIPKGTEITAYINGNFPINLAKFQSPAGVAPATTVAATGATTELDLSSTPAGAEIGIDGNFVGNTPSSLSVVAGDHTISIKLAG